MKTFQLLMVAALFSSQAIYADSISLNTNTKVQRLNIKGEEGGPAQTMFNAAKYLAGDPAFPPFERTTYRGFGIDAHVRNIDDSAMDSKQFTVAVVLDGTEAHKIAARTVRIEGEVALHLLRGMWLMSMDYEDNFRIQRSERFGDIVIHDLLSNQIACGKETREDQKSKMLYTVAFCTLEGKVTGF